MASDAVLTVVKGGISRLRAKGAAVSDSLYDLLNGRVSESKTVVVRPGTFREAVLPEETHGLTAYAALIHLFAIESVDVPEGHELHVITHPTDATIELAFIHYAEPFMGFLYVAAEFVDGTFQHYWLQTGAEWQAETIYRAGDIVIPTTPNGFAYQATRLTPPNNSWAPNVLRDVGDIVEPTVYNDFYYTVVDVQGDNPRSGTTEPTWPTEDGAQVIEDAEGTTAPQVPTEPPDVTAQPNPETADRYSNGVRS